jgi:hypothetical protein
MLPPAMDKGFTFFTHSILFYYTHPNKYKLVSHHNLDFTLLLTMDVEHLYIYLLANLHIFFEELSIRILCPSLNWVVFLLLNYKSPLYILDAGSLADASFINAFSHLWDFFYFLDDLL